jgi:hypothetical protein
VSANIQKIIIVLVIIINAGTASAVFMPIPPPEEEAITFDFGLDPKMYFSPNYKLKHFGASAAMTYNIWEGLAVGVQLRGGINDFSNGLFSSSTTYTGDLGGDVMARYLIKFCRFYTGVQAVYGYDYLFNSAAPLGKDSLMNLQIGIPVGLTFEEVVSIYVMPAVELGNQKATDAGPWGSLVSGSVAFGMSIYLGGPSLLVELSPRIDDFSSIAKTTGLKAFLGIGLGF